MASPLLINEPPLQVLPTLARRIGLNEAIVLQQIHYWLNPQFNKNLFEGRYWVRNTYEQWQKQFPFRSERTLRRTIGSLEDSGLLVSCMAGHLRQIKFYTINYDLLSQIELIYPSPLLLAKTDTSATGTSVPDEQSEVKEKDSKTQESERNQEPHPSGQNGQLIKTHLFTAKWPDKKPPNFGQNPSEPAENKVIYPNWARMSTSKWPGHLDTRIPSKMIGTPGQSGQAIWTRVSPPKWPVPLDKMASPSGQNGHLSYTETTVGEYSKNTLPPPLLLSICNSAHEERQEEEDEEKKEFKFGNAGTGMSSACMPSTRASSEYACLKAALPGNRESGPEEMLIGEPALEKPSLECAQNEGTHAKNTRVEGMCVFSEMIAIWNQTVQAKLNPGQDYLAVHLTDRRKALLRQFLNTVFADKARHEQLDAWKDYCTLIARLRFLTGENSTGFKVTLDWALAPDKAYKVLEGGIYDKPKPLSDLSLNQSWEDLEAQIRQQVNAEDTRTEGTRAGDRGTDTHAAEAWLAICKNLATNLGHATFKSWFLKARLVQFTAEAATIQVETAFMKNYIENHFRFDVVRAIQDINPAITQISFDVPAIRMFPACVSPARVPTVGGHSGEETASQPVELERGDCE